MDMRKLIRRLSDLRAVSGREYRINNEIKSILEPYCDTVKIDNLGSVIGCKKCGKENAPKIMIEAHMDEIGLIVTSVSDDGFISFSNVGGVDNRILPSLEVTVHGKKDVYGVIGMPPISDGDPEKSYKTELLAIDTGLDADAVKDLITVGDCITLPQSVGKLGINQFSSKTMDDRASLAAIIKVMENLKDERLHCDVYVGAAVMEEVGCRGGKTTSFGINPDMAIAIDVTHGITPDNSDNAIEVGSGTAMSKGPNIHPKLVERIEAVAKANKIKYNIEIDGGATGTDAWEIQVSGGGIPTALMSIPLKYMHTSVETLDIRDIKATCDVITEFIKGLESDTSWLALWNN